MIGLLALINAILITIGQLLFKLGSNNITSWELNTNLILKFITNKYIVSGITLYGFTTLLWIYILSKAELSRVYPIQSLAFIFTILISSFVLEEPVSINRWIGAAIICLGAFIACYK